MALTNHHEDAGQGEGWTPSGYCSQQGSSHLPTASLRRSASAGPGEFPPCPEFSPSHCQWCQNSQPPE